MEVLFYDPKESETKQFQDAPIEIRFVEIQDVIMLMFKVGSLAWIDAPYSPHLSRELTKFIFPDDGKGLALTIVFADSNTGVIKSIRLIGMSEKFSKKFIGCVMENKVKPFDQMVYYQKINQIYNKYTTKELVKLSQEYCKIR